MKTTRLLTFLTTFFLLPLSNFGQCDLITVNGSTQMPDGVCTPVLFGMEAHYEFLAPIDTSLVQILFRWNDVANTETIVSGNWNTSRDSIWAAATHSYPPDDECTKTAESIVIYDGDLCISSGYQSQVFATWGTDEENSGDLLINPEVYYVCEGVDIIDYTFNDNSTFNCNLAIEADRPNRLDRWVQFRYNTYNLAGDRIPDVTVRDNMSVVHSMTDGSGAFLSSLEGAIVRIPYPADGPTETSFPISAPAGGVAGDIFEITLRNWNVCNPYDNTPNDGFPPSDIINGDNPPIETRARIEIIAPTPVVVPALFEFCTSDIIMLSATAGSAEIRWYKDSTLDTLLYTGTNFNPTLAPSSINPNLPGNYSYYITTFQGICESAPTRVDLSIYQAPNAANAGLDKTICSDTITLYANAPIAGTGQWTTTSSATIINPLDSLTKVTNLEFGANEFTWTISNGPCITSDNIIIYSDRLPAAANAGPNQKLCDINPVSLAAIPPTNMGDGIWNIVSGSGSFSDSTLPNALLTATAHDTNIVVWRVSSRYGSCPVSLDSVLIITDLSPGIANAGLDIMLCETNNAILNANPPLNNGSGFWQIESGIGTLSDSTNPNATFSGFDYGQTRLIWKLRSKLNICSTDTNSILISRDKSPGIADAGIDKAFCLVTQDTLSGNTPIIGTGVWSVLVNPSGIPPSFSPNNSYPDALFSVVPGSEGAYTLEWQLINGACTSVDTLILDFGIPVPQADAGRDTVACGYDYEMHGNSIAIGKGTWTVLSGPGFVSINPDQNTPKAIATFLPGNEGLYSFDWTFTSGSCPPTHDTVDIEITIAPLPPIFTDRQSCGPDTFLINVPPGNPRNIAYWYESDTSTAYFYKGNSYATGVVTSTNSSYVKLIDTVSTCKSKLTPISITIDEVPAIPVLSGDTLCSPGQSVLTGTPVAPANTILWYSNLTTSPVDTGNTFMTDSLFSTEYFYGRSINTVTNCFSEYDSTLVVVHSVIPAPISYNDSSCGSSSFVLRADKSASSNSLFWYDELFNLIGINDSLITTLIDTTSLFYVAEYNPITKCLSESSSFKLMIHPIPDTPILIDTSSCGAASFVIYPTAGNNTSTFHWYDSPIGGNLIVQSDSLVTPLLVANTSYWVSGINNSTGCESPREQLEIFVYPSPAAVDILGPTLVLKDQSNVVFFTINGQAGSTFTWDIPSDIIVESNMNDFVRLAFPIKGNYTISVFETTINGCIGNTVFHNITVIEDSIAVDIGDFEQGACTAESFKIKPWLFGGTPPYIYQWTGDTEYLTSTNTLFTTFKPPGVGQFKLYVEVVDVNLKVTYDSVLITVYESPNTTILNTDTVACVDESYQIKTLSSGSTPFSHIWSGPIHRLNNYTLPEPVYVPHTADTAYFYYTLTDANKCRAYDSIAIVSDEPVASFNVLTDPGCSPLPVSFDNNSQNAISFDWQFGSLGSSIEENPEFTFINNSSEIKYIEVILEVNSPLGCKDNAANYVMVWPNPKANITALPQVGCNPINTLLVSTPGNRFYHWSFGDESNDTTTGSFNLYHSYSTNGYTDKIFRARVITESSLNCTDTAYLDITSYARPEVDFTVSPEQATFPNNGFAIQNNTIGNWSYNWSFGDGTSSNQKQPIEKAYDEQGYYSISLTASGSHCSDSLTKNVRLHPAPPIAKFKGADNGCMPHTVTLINNSQNADSYLWDFGDGSVSTAKDPSYTYYESGIYNIKLKVSGPGGESEYKDTSRVFILPNSFFELAPRYVYVNDEAVHYFNLSDNADAFEWDFGDGNTSTELNPKHVYKQEGNYDVTLKVWTENACFDLYIMENAVLVEPSGVVKFPNAFRPNSNIEENRVFKPGVIDHVEKYHLMIFNRWGELIYESYDQEIGWDGYYQGKVAKQDVYIWKVKGNYSDGKGFVKTGDVTLLY